MRKYFKPTGLYKWTYIIGFPHNISYFIHWIYYSWQRAFRGYSEYDTWSVDRYLSEIIPEMIIKLIENQKGSPEGVSITEWEIILQGIREGFVAATRINNCEYEDGKEKEQYHKDLEVFNKGMDLLKEHFFYLWD